MNSLVSLVSGLISRHPPHQHAQPEENPFSEILAKLRGHLEQFDKERESQVNKEAVDAVALSIKDPKAIENARQPATNLSLLIQRLRHIDLALAKFPSNFHTPTEKLLMFCKDRGLHPKGDELQAVYDEPNRSPPRYCQLRLSGKPLSSGWGGRGVTKGLARDAAACSALDSIHFHKLFAKKWLAILSEDSLDISIALINPHLSYIRPLSTIVAGYLDGDFLVLGIQEIPTPSKQHKASI